MSGVFRNIDPPPPHRPASVYPRLWCGGRTHSLALGGEDARHCSVLYIYLSTLWFKPSDSGRNIEIVGLQLRIIGFEGHTFLHSTTGEQ